MNENNSIQRSWWRRLARRTRTEAPRTNRLSHFEPLEQRTVLSASVFLPGDVDFFRTPHDADSYDVGPGNVYTNVYDVAPTLAFLGSEHVGPELHEQYESRDPLYGPHGYSDSLMLFGGMVHELPPVAGPMHPAYYASGAEGEATLGSSMPAFVGPLFQTNTAYKFGIVIVHDDAPNAPTAMGAIVFAPAAPPRITMLTPVDVSAADMGFIASLVAAAAMQRRVETPSYNYTGQSRIGSLSAMSEDAGSTTGKSLESTLQANSASLLAALATGSSVNLANGAHISMSGDDGSSSDDVLSQNTATRSSGEESDGLAELTAADLAAQKRKLASDGEPSATIQSRLEDLTDTPVIRVTESLFRELLVQYQNSTPTTPQQSAQPSNADDGMIELIAADVGTVASRHGASPVTDPSQPALADSGIALYQTLEVAGLDDIAEVAAAVPTQAAPVAPTGQVAKAE
jgi:hypothetical protein